MARDEVHRPLSERRVAGAAAIGVLGMLIVSLALRVSSGRGYVYLYDFAVAALSFAPLGALILIRRPRQTIGRLLLGLGIALGLVVLMGSIAVATGSGALALLSLMLRLGAIGGAGLVFLLFPTGSPPSPRWRAAGWVFAAGTLLTWLGVAISSGPIEDVPTLINPIGFTRAGEAILGVGFTMVAIGIFAAAVSIVFRFRRASGVERQQVKLFAFVAVSTVVLIVAFSGAFPKQMETTYLGNIVWGAPSVLLPAAVVVAILRHGLYDIDRIISRTLAYSLLTASLIGGYALSVFVLGTVLRPVIGSGEVVVATSTLVVAAAFGPARRRTQAFIDRRFNRARYDAARTIEAFSARLREETDLDALHEELLDVVRRTMSPASVSLWLREPASSGLQLTSST